MNKEIILYCVFLIALGRFVYTELVRVIERNHHKRIIEIKEKYRDEMLAYGDKIIEMERNHTKNVSNLYEKKLHELYKKINEQHQEILIKDHLLTAKINDCNK